MKRLLNWKPGPVSPLKYSLIKPKLLGLPIRSNLKYDQSPVEDQGESGSCTAQAIAGALEFLALRALSKKISAPQLFNGVYKDISRLFIYYNERRMEGNVYSDAGAYIYDGVQSVQSTGFCSEALWPFNLNKLYNTPSQAAYNEASAHQAVTAYSIDTQADIKNCLASGYPVIFGTEVCQSFVNIGRSGVYAGSDNERSLGGHAMLIVAYDDHYQSYTIRNSWGTGFGDHGYCYANYSWAEGFSDMHTIR